MTASVKPLPVLKKRQLSPKQLQQPKNRIGALGEQRALAFLLKHNFTLLDQNIRFGTSELDLIMLDIDTNEVVFIEVKTRSSKAYGHPTTAVTFRKLRAMKKAALAYLQACQLENCFRFDIITVLPTNIEHFVNITW